MQDEAYSCLHERGGHVYNVLSGRSDGQWGHSKVCLLIEGTGTYILHKTHIDNMATKYKV